MWISGASPKFSEVILPLKLDSYIFLGCFREVVWPWPVSSTPPESSRGPAIWSSRTRSDASVETPGLEANSEDQRHWSLAQVIQADSFAAFRKRLSPLQNQQRGCSPSSKCKRAIAPEASLAMDRSIGAPVLSVYRLRSLFAEPWPGVDPWHSCAKRYFVQ